MNSSHLPQSVLNTLNDATTLRRNPSNSFRQGVNPHSLQQLLHGAGPSQPNPPAHQLQLQQQAASTGAPRQSNFQSNNRVSLHRRLPQGPGPLTQIGQINRSRLGRRGTERLVGNSIVNSSLNSTSVSRAGERLQASARDPQSTNPQRNQSPDVLPPQSAQDRNLQLQSQESFTNSFKFNPNTKERNIKQKSAAFKPFVPGLAAGAGNPSIASGLPSARQRGLSDQISMNSRGPTLQQSQQITTIGQLISNHLQPNHAIQIQTQDQGPVPQAVSATQMSPAAAQNNTLQMHEQHMTCHKGSPPTSSKAQLPKFKLNAARDQAEEEKSQEVQSSGEGQLVVLEPFEEEQIEAEQEEAMLTEAYNTRTAAMLPKDNKTTEKGCGPDVESEPDLMEEGKQEATEEERALREVQDELLEERLQQQVEELKAKEDEDNLSDLAEEIVKQARIEQRADRLIKDIIEAEGAGMNEQVDQEAGDSESPDSSESKPKSDKDGEDSKDQTDSNEETKDHQAAMRQSGPIGGESNSSSQSQVGSPRAAPSARQVKRKQKLRPSLLTSTGCGPDGSGLNDNAKGSDLSKGSGPHKIKVRKKPDQTQHISKFASSLVFNAIERVTKAGADLIIREPDANNPVHQLNRHKQLFDFDSEVGLENCRKFLECLENLFALSFLKRAPRDYRQNFTAAYRVLYDNPVASPLNYLVEILDSAQESFPYLWVNGKKYEFSELVLQQGNMMYQTFTDLKASINQLHLAVVNAKATMSADFCALGAEELLKLRARVERQLEQFDQDWSIYEKGYVIELMAIEADARRFVIEAIQLSERMSAFETEQRRRGKVFFTQSEEFNQLRNKFLRQICEINQVANTIGQGRDDLDVSVLVVADDIGRKVSANQSAAVRKLCQHIQRSFNNLRALFVDRYAENVEVVDPQLRNNPELVHLVARFEKAWCLGRTHLVPKAMRDQLISFSQLIEGTAEKYPQFQEQVGCSDAEIFLTIPYLLVLKSSLDRGNEAVVATQVCQRFFPSLFQEPENQDPKSCYYRFERLKADLAQLRQEAGSSFFDFYCKIEAQILLGTDSPTQTPGQAGSANVAGDIRPAGSSRWKLLESQAQVIKEIGVNLTRHCPTEWNEFMIVALGIPEDEPLVFQTAAETEAGAEGGGQPAGPGEPGQAQEANAASD